MPTMVSMIRGINVGGRRPLKMATLREIYRGLGFQDVRTYLQSGNAVCRTRSGDPERHASMVARAILEECGLEVSVAAMSQEALSAAALANPLLARPSIDPDFLHATFLIDPAGVPSLAATRLPLGPGEEAALVGRTVYVYCPNGYGKSMINNACFERAFSARATTRNWRTVLALVRMARGETA